MDSLLNSHVLLVVGLAVSAFLVGGLTALHQVAPHTETKVDDKVDEYGQKVLPFAARVLEFLQGRLK